MTTNQDALEDSENSSNSKMAPSTSFNIAVIIGSQRQPRACPQIVAFVHDVIAQHLPPSPSINLEMVDIAALNLPFFNEPGIPQKINDPSGYTHEHTRAWSKLVSSFDAFIFVTPQYNWGIPAGLKNAIDYLFNEWTGKPAMVVTYGGHGGDKVDAALRIVLGGGLKMKVVEHKVNLPFWGRDALYLAATGKDLGLDAQKADGPWADMKLDIIEAWKELLRTLQQEDI